MMQLSWLWLFHRTSDFWPLPQGQVFRSGKSTNEFLGEEKDYMLVIAIIVEIVALGAFIFVVKSWQLPVQASSGRSTLQRKKPLPLMLLPVIWKPSLSLTRTLAYG